MNYCNLPINAPRPVSIWDSPTRCHPSQRAVVLRNAYARLIRLDAVRDKFPAAEKRYQETAALIAEVEATV